VDDENSHGRAPSPQGALAVLVVVVAAAGGAQDGWGRRGPSGSAFGQAGRMRWDELFEDLEGQLAAADAAELAGEVEERTRLERGQIELADRVAAARGLPLTLDVGGRDRVAGRLLDVGAGWLLLDEAGAGTPTAPALVPMGALLAVSGLSRRADVASPPRRVTLAACLRAVARDRSPVRLTLRSGGGPDGPTMLVGTVDAVGTDHLDLAEHAADVVRRASAVRGVSTVPFGAIAVLRPRGVSSLTA
jgi:hypothetical protein